MRNISWLLPLLVVGCGGGSSSSSEPISATYQEIVSTSIQSDNSDLSSFIAATKGYDIVGLGESSHQGSKAYSLRARMIKALHEDSDLDIVMMESGLYDGLVSWNNYLTGKQVLLDAVTGPDASFMFMQKFSAEVAELFNYVNDTDQTTNPLILTAYDSRITSDTGCGVMFDELEDYLTSNALPLHNYAKVKTLAPMMMCPWYSDREFTKADHNALVDALSILETTLETRKPLETIPSYDPMQPRDFKQYASFWLQIARSISAQSHYTIFNEAYSYTDEQSAENVKWLIDEWFNVSGQSLLWGHNIHVTPLENSVIDTIYTRYPDVTVYNVMQLTHTGYLAPFNYDSSTWADNPLPVDEVYGSLNYRLYKSGFPDSFIDITSLVGEERETFDRLQTVKTDFGRPQSIVPSQFMEGILFIPVETPTIARKM